MNEQHFPMLERRALYEIGLPTALFWGAWLGLHLFQGDLRLPLGERGLNVNVYFFVLALGFSIVWLIAFVWTHTEIVLSPCKVRLEIFCQPAWEMPWGQLLCWTWDWHWTGVPQGIVLISQTGNPLRKLRLGFLGLGRRVGNVIVPYPPYVPLLKALGYFLPGEPWQEPPAKASPLKKQK